MKKYSSIFDAAGYNIAFHDRFSEQAETVLYVIHNRDGSPRWVWPRHLRQPLFLRCYMAVGWRARLWTILIRLVFLLRLQVLFFERKSALRMRHLGQPPLFEWESAWALFTGTAGPNRKGIFVVKEGQTRFVKVAVGNLSGEALLREAQALQRLSGHAWEHFDYPTLLHHGEGQLATAALPVQARALGWEAAHARAITELTAHTLRWIPMQEMPAWKRLHQQLDALEQVRDTRIPPGLLRKLRLMVAAFDPRQELAVAMCHGDFTPWNTYMREARLSIYDWELWEEHMPIGFDAFHFVIQTGILVRRDSWDKIAADLRQQLREGLWQQDLFAHNAGYEDHLRLYLLLQVVAGLRLYSQQTEWHAQVHWLIDTWSMGISSLLSASVPQRALLLMDSFDFLAQRPYVALKFPVTYPENLPADSDVDLCLPRTEANALIAWMGRHPLAAHRNCFRQSFMSQLQVMCTDGGLLSLDLIWDIRRKSLQVLDARTLYRRASANEFGVKEPRSLDLARYIGYFYALNGAPVPARWRAYREVLALSGDDSDRGLLPHFWEERHSAAALRLGLRALKANRGWRSLRNRFHHGIDLLRPFLGRRGHVITFSGVDGAGKSTVIAAVAARMEKQLRRKVVVLRHRPSLLPILSAWTKGRRRAEADAAARLPRQGRNNSLVSSLVRFAYYYTDYLLGQMWVQVRYVWRGEIVLYDRYYFDFITDSRRSNLAFPAGLARVAYGLLIKPRLNIFLYADPALVYQRKQELDPATIRHLSDAYRHLFDRLGRESRGARYISIENLRLDHTVDAIMALHQPLVA